MGTSYPHRRKVYMFQVKSAPQSYVYVQVHKSDFFIALCTALFHCSRCVCVYACEYVMHKHTVRCTLRM